MSRKAHTRRTVLKGIGAGTALLVGGVGSAAGEDEAGIRVAHASPDAPEVDVILTKTDDEDISQTVTVSFKEVTDYLEVPTGEYEVEVPAASGFSTTVELKAEDYTAVALGTVAEDTFTVKPFQDTNGANIGDDEARVRAIHASPDAPPVDVTVDDGALTLFEDFAFTESSGYTVVGADEYNVEVRPASGGDPVVEADVSLNGRSTYTVFAVDFLDSIDLLPVKDKGAPPRGDGNDGEDDDGDDDDDNGRGRGDGNDNGRGRGR